MVMRRRYRKRRRMIRRRMRRMRIRRGPRYDGAIAIKCQTVYTVNWQQVHGFGCLAVNWVNATSAGNNTITAVYTTNIEYTKQFELYNQLKVVGVRIKVIPVTNPTGFSSLMTFYEVGSDIAAVPSAAVGD